MSVELNHTIIWCSDQAASAEFLCEVLGLPEARRFSHFHVVDMGNGVSLDFASKEGPVSAQHYAFLVDEATFDHGLAQVQERGQAFWADPARTMAGEINRHWGGRGFYFLDPDGHVLELITKPYGAEHEI